MVLIPVLFAAFIFRDSFFNFFVQDDFILINQFSQGEFLEDLKNTFGEPEVTHWRPFHSLYFLISGNLFGKNYFFYHLLTFFLYALTGFVIYKITYAIFKERRLSIFASFFYLLNPLHFISLFWISGAATTIGFLLFSFSFYFYLIKKHAASICFFLFSLLASEGMIAGLVVFCAWKLLVKKNKLSFSFLAQISFASLVFLAVRYLFFTPKITFEVYTIEFSQNTLFAIKYYLTRILGFGETSKDVFPSVVLLIFLLYVVFLIFKKAGRDKNLRLLIFFLIIVTIGLFPFVLIPNHLSPHYMNISAFGFSMIVALALYRVKPIFRLVLAGLFLISSFLTVNATKNNNWVVERGKISRHYIEAIQSASLPKDSILIFEDNNFSTSKEAYISLGTGQALKFWFKGKNFKPCFVFYETCRDTSMGKYYVFD